jgi:hypothetical protein
MDEPVSTTLKKTDPSVTDASLKQKSRGPYQLHGIHARDRALRRHGLDAIDTRSAEGRDAMAWHNAVLETKGGKACPHTVRVEIRLATFDLLQILYVQSWIIIDANRRGTVVNRRRRELSRIHEQLDTINARFMRRCEALNLAKAQPMDLARRLQLAQKATDERK